MGKGSERGGGRAGRIFQVKGKSMCKTGMQDTCMNNCTNVSKVGMTHGMGRTEKE